jgi:hypothetical protein
MDTISALWNIRPRPTKIDRGRETQASSGDKCATTFQKQTITEIAKGVGYRCSNPECARPTVGANAAQEGLITIGVAAHICAASPGGPL